MNDLAKSLRTWLHGKWGALTISAAGTAAGGVVLSYLKAHGISCDEGVALGIPVFAGYFGALTGSVAGNLMTDEAKDFQRRLVQEDGIVNHDLQKLIRAGLIEVFREAGTEGMAEKNERRQLLQMAERLSSLDDEELWQSIITDNRLGTDSTPFSKEQVLRLFERHISDQTASDLSEDDWRNILRLIAYRLDTELNNRSLTIAASVATTHFSYFVRELAKNDFEQSGKQFAAVHLSLLGNLAAEVRSLRDGLGDSSFVRSRFTTFISDLASRFALIETNFTGLHRDSLLRLQDIVSRVTDVVAELRSVQRSVSALQADNTKAHATTRVEIAEVRQLSLSQQALLETLTANVNSLAKKDPGEGTAAAEALYDRVERLVRSSPAYTHSIDVASHLSALRQEILVLQDFGDPDEIIPLLKRQIKDTCIISEEYLTSRVSGASTNSRYLYSCSSLIDVGYGAYVSDGGWRVLLRRMGHAAQQPGSFVMRVFFVRRRKLALNELNALEQIVLMHLKQRVFVGLVDQDALPNDLCAKRNMAYIGGNVLLHATDQVVWDLDLSTNELELRDAGEKHYSYQERLLVKFSPCDEMRVRAVLQELFGLLITGDNE